MNNDLKNRVRAVMASIFRVPAESIADDASQDSIENWTSLEHMNLVTALEEEFGVMFKDEQIIEMLSFELVVVMVEEALTEK